MLRYSRTPTDAEPPNIRLDCNVSVRHQTIPELIVENSHLSTYIGFVGTFQDTERCYRRCPAYL